MSYNFNTDPPGSGKNIEKLKSLIEKEMSFNKLGKKLSEDEVRDLKILSNLYPTAAFRERQRIFDSNNMSKSLNTNPPGSENNILKLKSLIEKEMSFNKQGKKLPEDEALNLKMLSNLYPGAALRERQRIIDSNKGNKQNNGKENNQTPWVPGKSPGKQQ